MRTKGTLVAGSIQHWKSSFAVGEVRWKPTTLAKYQHDQREIAVPKSRRIERMKDWVFAVGLFTAISTSRAGDIHYVLRVERLS